MKQPPAFFTNAGGCLLFSYVVNSNMTTLKLKKLNRLTDCQTWMTILIDSYGA